MLPLAESPLRNIFSLKALWHHEHMLRASTAYVTVALHNICLLSKIWGKQKPTNYMQMHKHNHAEYNFTKPRSLIMWLQAIWQSEQEATWKNHLQCSSWENCLRNQISSQQCDYRWKSRMPESLPPQYMPRFGSKSNCPTLLLQQHPSAQHRHSTAAVRATAKESKPCCSVMVVEAVAAAGNCVRVHNIGKTPGSNPCLFGNHWIPLCLPISPCSPTGFAQSTNSAYYASYFRHTLADTLMKIYHPITNFFTNKPSFLWMSANIHNGDCGCRECLSLL